jgi:hypothetical protein
MLTFVLLSHLVVSAAPCQLTVDVQPEGVEVKVDGKKAGISGKPIVLKLKPGHHVVRLTRQGDSHEEEVSLKAGEKKTYSWVFEDERKPSDNGEVVAP